MFEVFRFIAENAHGQTEVELQMKCRYCLGTESRVVDSRPTEDGTAIRRRRECSNCRKRFTTYEKIEDIPGRPEYILTRRGVGYYMRNND